MAIYAIRNTRRVLLPNSAVCVFFVFFLLGNLMKLSAQDKSGDAKLEIIQDHRIDSMLKRQIALNGFKKTISGFRVQIYSGQQRNKANELRGEFNSVYSDMPSYLLYQQPNFKVRVGDFRSRLEAYKFMRSLQTQFSNSFIVNDEIVIPELEGK
jgi:hypothetical protein